MSLEIFLDGSSSGHSMNPEYMITKRRLQCPICLLSYDIFPFFLSFCLFLTPDSAVGVGLTYRLPNKTMGDPCTVALL